MTRRVARIPDLFADPFHERATPLRRAPVHVLGARFSFEANDARLLGLVDHAYANLPRHRLARVEPRLRVALLRAPDAALRSPRSEPPALGMLSGGGFLAGATGLSDFVTIAPGQRAALVTVSERMLRFPYHTRYELIEFAVFTLAARVQGLMSLHAACVGLGGRGLLLMGASGAGKSTVALQCLLAGFDFVSEDSTFVTPDSLLVTGVANFLHVRSDSLRWVTRARDAAAIRRSPVITRRSGMRKFEVDLRRPGYKLASAPQRLASIIFLSARRARGRELLRPLSKAELSARLAAAQPYAANHPQWRSFSRNAARVGAFELRRGPHPLSSVEALRELLASHAAISSSSSIAAGRTRDT